ncbi:MAG: hypothetical protein FWC74_08105 [Candidatus Bathyarchaeota archaeon]|nr:hypothetical protein [Candidatus Termitimicrobium sp.]
MTSYYARFLNPIEEAFNPAQMSKLWASLAAMLVQRKSKELLCRKCLQQKYIYGFPNLSRKSQKGDG